MISAIASQITSLTIVYSTVYSGADQRKYQNSASLAFVRVIHRSPVNSPHKGPITRKMFPFDDVIMNQMKTANSYTNCIISVSSQTARTADLSQCRLILHGQATIQNFMIYMECQRRDRNISHKSCTFRSRVNSAHLLIQFAWYLDAFSYDGIKIPTDSLLKVILLRQRQLIHPHLVSHMSVDKLCHHLFR